MRNTAHRILPAILVTLPLPACASSPPRASRAPLLDPSNPEWSRPAPAVSRIRFETSKGDFVAEVVRAWAPLGADRFYNLARLGFSGPASGCRFASRGTLVPEQPSGCRIRPQGGAWPTATPLYPLVQHHLETFLADAAAADPHGEGVPRWVESDFRANLRCGILAHGFARIRCDACAAERLVAFLLQGARRPPLLQRPPHGGGGRPPDLVLPPLPLRQWVLSLPKRIRPFLPHDPRLAGDVLRVLLRAIRTTLRRASPGAAPDAQLGAPPRPA